MELNIIKKQSEFSENATLNCKKNKCCKKFKKSGVNCKKCPKV